MHRYTYHDGARLLISQPALPDLTLEEALRIVPYMNLTLARRGAVLFRAGGPGSHFMVMLLDGDAVVEGQLTGASDALVLRSLVPGSLFGELGALDSIARSVTVRATVRHLPGDTGLRRAQQGHGNRPGAGLRVVARDPGPRHPAPAQRQHQDRNAQRDQPDAARGMARPR